MKKSISRPASLAEAPCSAVPITAHRLAHALAGALCDHDGREPLADFMERKLLEWGCPARSPDITPQQVRECTRLPFKLTIYDETGTHTVAPLWLDVPVDGEGAWEPVPDDFPGGHWEHIARMEMWAKKQILAGDIECSLDTDTLINPPNE